MQGGIDPELPVTATPIWCVPSRPGAVDACACVFADGDCQRSDQERVEYSRVLISLREAGWAPSPAPRRNSRRRSALGAHQGKLPTSMWIEIVSTRTRWAAVVVDDDVRARGQSRHWSPT